MDGWSTPVCDGSGRISSETSTPWCGAKQASGSGGARSSSLVGAVASSGACSGLAAGRRTSGPAVLTVTRSPHVAERPDGRMPCGFVEFSRRLVPAKLHDLCWGGAAAVGSGGGWVELVPAAPEGRAEVVERVGQAWVGVAQRLPEGDLTESAFADHRRDGCHVVALACHEGLVDRSPVPRHDDSALRHLDEVRREGVSPLQGP